MESEQLKLMLSSMVPFNGHLGLEVLDVEQGLARVQLPEAPYLLNHVGTQHAGALFAVAEAASGGAVIGAFSSLIGKVTPLARDAQIKFLKPARGSIVAEASIDGDVEAIGATLDSAGRANFSVNVVLRDAAGVEVAKVRVSWHLRRNAQ